MNITIVGDQAERLEIIRQLLDEKMDWTVSVLSLNHTGTAEFSTVLNHSDLALVDLAYVSEPAPIFIQYFKKQYPDTRIIGMHFYRNMKLIEPLLEAGLDGYVHSNSKKSILFEAIEDVSENKEFIMNRG